VNPALFDAAIAVKPAPRVQIQPVEEKALSERPRVVIVGGGFGGLCAAKALAKAPVEVTLIDRHNYHLFQPLLY
jgi:NADPH-dependent 2,4-dienoyl-CoA reductase/sulfur reductase-like enzyme